MIVLYFVGNLALSRALGDFVFKKNETKKPEDQIVTGKCIDLKVISEIASFQLQAENTFIVIPPKTMFF